MREPNKLSMSLFVRLPMTTLTIISGNCRRYRCRHLGMVGSIMHYHFVANDNEPIKALMTFT